MKILQYFRQAWHMMCQQRLFSSIYIVGTALAIATTTVFALMFYIKIAPVYPEYNRGRSYYMDRGHVYRTEGGSAQSSLNYEMVRDNLYTLKDADAVTSYIDEWDASYVTGPDGNSDIKVVTRPTDPAYFTVYPYEFTEGAPFTQSDMDGKLRKALITDALARKVFGTDENVTGREILLNFKPYDVAGVVRGGSSLLTASYGDIFFPYTTVADYDEEWWPWLGSFHTIILSDKPESLHEQIEEIQRRINTSQDEYTLDLLSQPKSHVEETYNYFMNDDFSFWKVIRNNMTILLILLLVPALNLSGMISSRMDMRASELGLRKSFGATRGKLLSQIMWENLLLTLIGGLVGLLLCWLVLWLNGGSVLALDAAWNSQPESATSVTSDMLFSPWIFLITFVLCLLLNTFSALLPAWVSLRRPIVSSLKEK